MSAIEDKTSNAPAENPDVVVVLGVVNSIIRGDQLFPLHSIVSC